MKSHSTNEDDILSKLQSSGDITGIHRLFTAHLHPFTPFFAPSSAAAKKPPKSSKSKPPHDLPSVSPLAKQFSSFILKSISLLHKHLSESPKIPKDSALELFKCYHLCLDCLDLIAPKVTREPYQVQLQRIRYIHCLRNWEMFEEAEAECFVVLESVKAIVGGGQKGRLRKTEARLVPEFDEETVDRELAAKVSEIVVTLVICAAERKRKTGADYWRVISLVNESEPWFKILDAKNYKKFHDLLVKNLHIIAIFLVAEIKSFCVDLICEFTLVTLKEYKESRDQEQMYKAALEICSSLFSQKDELSSGIIFDVLKQVLDFMAASCKDGLEKTTLGFLELVSYCANECQSVTVGLCGLVAEHLFRLAGAVHEDFPFISSILRLYASGLLAVSSNQPQGEDIEKCKSAPLGSGLQVLLHNRERLQQMAVSIDFLDGHFGIGSKDTSSHEKGISNLSYWKALKFLCQPLAESIYSNRKEFFSEADTASSWEDLSSILDAFHKFCLFYFKYLSSTERERETSGEKYKVIYVVVVAALMLSFKANQNIEESILLVKHAISAQWVPVERLMFIYVYVNNIAEILNSKKWLKENIISLRLCCKALRYYVVHLCEKHANRSQVSHDDISEKTISDFVTEASGKIVLLLQLNQENNFKINGIITESLVCWSVSESLIATLPTPVSLVKEWVKIQYTLWNGTEHEVMLYSLLSSSKEISKRALGKLLEEELLAYVENSYLNPRYFFRMKMKVINILLEEIYVTNDSSLQKCRVLIEKAKSLRAHGLPRRDECIQCLSDAISTLKLIYSARTGCSSRVHHPLVHAYLLRALSTQEATPSVILSPKSDFLHDINDALNLFMSPDHGHIDEYNEDILYLWYEFIDLLSIKGYLEMHPRLYDVVIKLFSGKSFSLAKTVALLWKNKRLSHALCASPVNDMFIGTFSKHQSQLCNSKFWSICMEEMKPLVVGFDHIDNELKEAASELISKVPLTSCSSFISSNLYYDLSERLISSGQMVEALTYAKKALSLRGELLLQKFDHTVKKLTETFDEQGETIEKSYYGIQTFKVTDFEGRNESCDYDGCVLTPWNVLSCYLESTLQVGFVQEVIGDVAEADVTLWWGRSIAQFQTLPLFEISFACGLGKLYCKQKLWSMAERELSRAKQTLADNVDTISCKKCLCVMEISINQQLGDLFLSSSCCIAESPFANRLFNAKSLYKSALDKLSMSDWRSSYRTSEDSLSNDKPESKIKPRRSRRTKKEVKPASHTQDMIHCQSRRITRSVHRSLGETHEIEPCDRQTSHAYASVSEHLSTASVGSDPGVISSNPKSFSAEFQSGIRSLCSNMRCLHCLLTEALDSGCNLNIFMRMNWELIHRKLCLRLLVSIGKFSGVYGHVHEAHDILLQSISIFFSGNSNCSKHSSESLDFLMESIGKHFPGDVLAVERAALLYYVCWFTVKSYSYQGTRNSCCDLSCIGTVRIISFLKLAFILCRDVPLLFQKVSRLLAAIYVLSTSLEQFSLSPNDEDSESQWASFFHQASLGNQLNQQILSGMLQKKQSQLASDFVDSLPNSVSGILGLPRSIRPAPNSCEDLDKFVLEFFQGLPLTPVICISLVAGDDADLLRELLHCSPKVRAWILLSHLSSDNQHVVLLPVHKILEGEASDDDANSVVSNCKDFVKPWQCPWVSSVIDDIAPVFRHVLEGNYISSTSYFEEYIRENTSLWWTQRTRLDECLSKFLQDVEDLWLGTWKYLLLGKWPDCNYIDSVLDSLSKDEGLLLQLVVTKKCYVGQISEGTSNSSIGFESMMQLLFKRIFERPDAPEQDEYMARTPIILVLDSEVQMLPWENLPILRDQEVYRMPSIGSIFATLDRFCQKNKEQFEASIPVFPLIDPLDSYYLLNPNGDLSRTQVEFESWFNDQNVEGKIGTVPTVEELTLALKNHDLFIYLGHGSGTQYISERKIQKLDGCAATFLLGCNSGSLYLNGSYMPRGAPISYILAGSPVIVAILWDVTDRDIDRFGKAMLNAWLRERSAECSVCKFRNCRHRRRIGSFMGEARDACTLPYLIGAAPVCYGVPTGIIKRKTV